MNQKKLKLFIPFLVGPILVFLLLFTLDAKAEVTDIDINGLYWGDGDYQEYTLRSESPGGRGFIYADRVSADRIYALVRVSYSVNDNAFKPVKDSYIESVGWNPPHSLSSLIGSDHLAMFMECGDDRWEWKQDLLYDFNESDPVLPDPVYDWRSDQFGPDGAAVTSSTGAAIPPSGIVIESNSSTEYVLENSSWILSDQWSNSTNYNDWMSLDLDPLGTISKTVPITDVNAITGVHEDYPFYRSTGAAPNDLFEWEVSYEMILDVSHCGSEAVYLGADSAHNSASKDGDEDVEIPTAINLVSFSVDFSEPSRLPALLVGAGLLVVLVVLALILVRSNRRTESDLN
jgi:hypothetical protein